MVAPAVLNAKREFIVQHAVGGDVEAIEAICRLDNPESITALCNAIHDGAKVTPAQFERLMQVFELWKAGENVGEAA